MVLFFFIVLSFADAFLSIESLIKVQKADSNGEEVSWVDTEVEELHFYDQYFKNYVRAMRVSYLTSIGEFDES